MGVLSTKSFSIRADALPITTKPREIRFVDAVPRTSSGKILRRELKIMVLEESGEGFERTSSPRPSC
jgi:acyl-coenzyme A synthetase/AMP-(fatty) acid ligase